LVQERGSEKKVVGKCAKCRKSAVKKDTECHVAMVEMAGQDDCLDDNVLEEASQVVDKNTNEWCCMSCVISLQDDFINEKPDIQHYLEGRGHVCLFYPKFHCEINPIEMLWGYMKYCVSHVLELALILTCSEGFHAVTDGKFATAKMLVPQCLDMADTHTIQCFFQKTW
jgi:hypothetical protein